MKKESIKIDTSEYLNFSETDLTVIGIRKDGVVEIRFKVDEYEVDTNDQMAIHDVFVSLTGNGTIPYHVLVVPGKYGSINKEAREMEMFDTNAFRNQKSLAIVATSLHQRLLGNMYLTLKKKKPKYPCKFFDTEELALAWIQNIKT